MSKQKPQRQNGARKRFCSLQRERQKETTFITLGLVGYGGGLWLEVWAYMLFMLFKHKLWKVLGGPAQCILPRI